MPRSSRAKIPKGSDMVAAIIGLVLLIVLVIVAIRMISMRHAPDDVSQEGIDNPLIHESGIYYQKDFAKFKAKVLP